MAWLDIKYSCGHTARTEFAGPWKERDRKRQWLEEYGLCPNCYKESLEIIRKEKLSQVQVQFPELVGSEKQMAWANKIREDRLIKLLDWIEDKGGLKRLKEESGIESLQEVIDKVLEVNNRYSWIITETSAKTIIEKYQHMF